MPNHMSLHHGKDVVELVWGWDLNTTSSGGYLDDGFACMPERGARLTATTLTDPDVWKASDLVAQVSHVIHSWNPGIGALRCRPR